MSTDPPDMDLDVAEVECATQQNSPGDNNNFIQVEGKRRRTEGVVPPTPPIPPTIIDVSSLNRENYYGILGDLEIKSQPHTPSVSKPDKVVTSNTTEKTLPTRKSFCPPIFLFNVNVQHLIDQLGVRTPPISFKVKNVSKNKSKLFLADPLIHADMMRLLKEKQIPAYSFTPRELRQTSLILRGLYHGCEVSDVKDALDKIAPGVVFNVVKYTTKHSYKNGYDTGLLLVTLSPGKGLTDLANIKSVLSQIVTWEKPKKKDQELQCRRCQKWGHIAKNCSSQFKCVKCDQNHEPGKCQRIVSEESAPQCVNCGEAGHPASWKGCKSYKSFVQFKKDKVMKVRMEKINAARNVNRAVSSGVRLPGKTFAELFHPQPQSTEPQEVKSGIIEEFLKLTAYFMQPEELSLEDEIRLFMRDYKNMSRQEAKIEFTRLLQKVRAGF